MYKTKRSKLFSVGLAVLLLCSLFVVPTAADAENAFANPEFSVEGNEVTGWTRNSYSDVYPSVAGNILVQGTEGYDEDAPVAGNIFTSTTSGFGLKSNYLLLNEDGRCYISVWYKSKLDGVMQVVVEEFAIDGTTRLKATTINCPSTSGDWKLYKMHFKEKMEGKRVRVTFRMNDNGSNLAVNGDVHFMSPYYTADVPENYLVDGGFDNGVSTGWSKVGTPVGEFSVKAEENGNYYLEIAETSNGENSMYRVSYNTPADLLLTYGNYYKFSYKFKPVSDGSTPMVELVQITAAGGEISRSSYGEALGTPVDGGWTEYVGYIHLNAQKTPGDDTTKAERIQIRARAKAGMTVAYDDFKIEDAKNNIMIYQNGIETDTLDSNATVSARYHNVSTKSSMFILARYTLENNVKKLADVKIVTAPNGMTAFSDDSVLEISNTQAGDTIKAFALSIASTMVPDAEMKIATVLATASDI